MIRRLFTFASALSLLLCAATAAEWVRSYRVPNLIAWQGSPFKFFMAFVVTGRIKLGYVRWPPDDGICHHPGVQWVDLPFWDVAAGFAGLPLCWVLHAGFRASRPRPGQCAVCGYDLRASTDRCPECGRAVPQKTEARA